MERNPYTPPSTPVADIAGPSVTPNREVQLACKLFWGSFGVSLVGSASDLLSVSAIGLRIKIYAPKEGFGIFGSDLPRTYLKIAKREQNE